MLDRIAETELAGGYPYTQLRPDHRNVRPEDATCTATNYDELRDCLENASNNEVVWVPGDAEIDHTPTITGDGPIEVTADNVTLASDRGYTPDSPGGLLYRDEIRDYEFGIVVTGDRFWMNGIRMRGGAEYSDPPTEGDMDGEPDDINMLIDESDQTIIENCEISHFRSRGLEVRDSNVRVHHCHIHHNVIFGNGYGIDNVGSDMIIEYNYFNYHRHAIAGNSPETIRETIRKNVFGDFWINDEIDIHAASGAGSFGGIAPEFFDIYENLFLGEPSINSGQSHIHPEAVSAELSYITGNWFTLDWDSDSPPIRQEGEVREGEWENMEVANNHFGVDEDEAWAEFKSLVLTDPDDGGDTGGDTGDTGGSDGDSDGDVGGHTHDEYAPAEHAHAALSDGQESDVLDELSQYMDEVSVSLSDGNED